MDKDEKRDRREESPHAVGRKTNAREGSSAGTLYPDVTDVTGTREEVALLFGESLAGYAGGKNLRARLKERVILSPLTAKRLAILMDTRIREHESRYGPIKAKPLQGNARDKGFSIGETPSFFRTKKSAEKARLVFHVLKDLKITLGLERSFKVYKHTLLENRFLLGLSKASIEPDASAKIRSICRRMDMPEDLWEIFFEQLPRANYIHFGFEETERSCLYKSYLEFADRFKDRIESQPQNFDPFLLHLGFKWDAQNNTKQALARYSYHPFLSVETILERVSRILRQDEHRVSFEITRGILETASGRIKRRDIVYIEVTEENNPRKSFAINLYNAHIRLHEFSSILRKMCRHYGIHPEEFQELYHRIADKRFGHISGGVDREGREFVTIYFGVEGYSFNRSRDNESRHIPRK